MQQAVRNNSMFKTSTLVKVGILSAIGYILMFISIPLPMFFPEFLKIDVSDLPALLGGIALGPLPGLVVAFIKNLLQFVTGVSTTGGVGELANFLIGGSFVWVVSFMYSKKNDAKGIIIGLLLGIVVMTVVGCIANYSIILPFYSKIGLSMESIVSASAVINPNVVDKITFILWIIAPFNILKASIMSLLTFPMYKKTEKILNKIKS